MPITLEELQIKFIAETGALKSQLGGVQKQLTGLEQSVAKSQSQLAGFEQSAVKSQKALGLFGKAAIVAGVVKAGKAMVDVGREALLMANDVVESEQLFEVSMGNMEASARAWSESLSASLGLNAYDLRKNVGMLNVMFGSMGLGEQEAYDMSTSMVQLANDMASFYNLDTEEAFTKLRAGITGETEPLKRLGILVDEQTVAQYALKSGISKTGKELTQQQKLQARYGAIMEQTAKAQGDLARTMDSPTNQLRRLNAEFDMAKIALGKALQPALIAVLPVMSSFARGLTNMLKGSGVSTGNPFSDVVVSLASATATVSTGVSTLTQETVEKVNELKAQVETALNEYAAAASETKTAYIDITMKPKSTAYMRILGVFTQLNKQIDTAQTLLLKDEIKEKLDVILEDGVVTGPEQKSLLDYLTEVEAALKTEAEDKLKAIQAKAKYQLNTGEIDLPTHDQMLIDAQAEYDATIGTIESLIAKAKANVNISGWTMSSLSPEDRELLRSVMQTTMDKELAVALTAKATASALFEGTGNVENVVEGVYSNALTLLEAKRQQISDLMNNSIDADWDWSKINSLRQEMADIISFITKGITPMGEFDRALFDLQRLSPESLTSFANAYKNTLNTMSAAEQEQLKMREDLLFSLNAAGDVLGVQDVLDQYGYKSFDEAILDIRKQSADSVAYAQGGLLSDAADAMVPQLQSLMRNAKTLEEVNSVKDMIFEMLSAVDYSNLNEDAKKAVQSLVNIMDNDKVRLMFGSDTNFFGVIDDYLRQIYRENYGKGGGAPMPNPYRVGDDNTPPAWYSQPQTDNPINPWQPAVIPEIIIDKPRVELKDPGYVSSKGWMSPGSMPPQSVNVDVAPQDIVVYMYLDETQLGRANIRATQTVTKSTGGGKTLISVPMQVIN